ncbi:MAG: heme-binding protein [Actinomycetota bacterium]
MSVLSLELAKAIIDKALETGRALELAPLAVAVLDPGGHLKAFAREDGAGILRPQIATAKAWSALGLGSGTRSLVGKSPEFVGALAAISKGRIMPSPGGVLIRDADGTLLGAIGVTGDKGERDEVCAVAGVEALGLVAETG